MTSAGTGASPRGARRPRWAVAVAGLGVVLVAATAVAACQSSPPPDTGAVPVTTTTPATPGPTVRDGSVPTGAAEQAPARLVVPALKLNAAVDAVGIDERTGDFAVPPSVDRVGWYRFGPGFAAGTGSIVVAGHVDSAEQGKGAFFRLGRMATGDRITLTGPDGAKREFEVVARKRYDKKRIPLDEYFARDGDLRLTLITCGGPFDQQTRSYRDNVVVTATPVGGR